MELKWKLHQYTFVPTSYVTDETGHPGARKIMGVKRGTLVSHVAMRVGIQFDGTVAITVGDGGNASGFMTDANTDVDGSTGLKNGTGEYLITQDTGAGTGPNANGKLYTEDDTIDLAYNYTTEDGDTTTKGQVTVYIVYAEIE